MDDYVDNPVSFVNDGLFEVVQNKEYLVELSQLAAGATKLFAGGLTSYDRLYERCKQMTVYNRNYDKEGYVIP